MPVLYDDCLKVSVSFLKRHGYLKPDHCQSGTIFWSVGEGESKEITARIGISVNTYRSPYIELYYTCNSKPVNYRVQLVSIPSNLGKGVVWFFVCPHTGKRCRKLYLVGERFLHRKAFIGCMYKKQTQSKRWRLWDSILDCEDAKEKIHSRYFKKHYNGKPTKRYSQLLKKGEKIVSPFELEKLFR
ncbi:MAG: hypothetical protein EPN85_02415 [Bacteroidetes bacterium]|nr:MAG: hypothetical protein EPN85_02415 [Bacteroidota bacterium]